MSKRKAPDSDNVNNDFCDFLRGTNLFKKNIIIYYNKIVLLKFCRTC